MNKESSTGRKSNKSTNGGRVKKTTKAKKGNKTKKALKNIHIKSKKKRNGRKSKQLKQISDMTRCVGKIAENFKNYVEKVRTLGRLIPRIEKQNKNLVSKKSKNEDYEESYQTLLSAMGGNKSAPKCNGQLITETTEKYNGKRLIWCAMLH